MALLSCISSTQSSTLNHSLFVPDLIHARDQKIIRTPRCLMGQCRPCLFLSVPALRQRTGCPESSIVAGQSAVAVAPVWCGDIFGGFCRCGQVIRCGVHDFGLNVVAHDGSVSSGSDSCSMCPRYVFAAFAAIPYIVLPKTHTVNQNLNPRTKKAPPVSAGLAWVDPYLRGKK